MLPNLEEVLNSEADLQEIAGKGAEHKEGIVAFLEKRNPKIYLNTMGTKDSKRKKLSVLCVSIVRVIMEFEPVIGLEVHAELRTQSKMFCSCAVVDSTSAAPNTAVCPVCSAMPGALPVVNQKAVEYGIRVALALECEVQNTSIFARKNYFYPDLPKGYQISQYEQPLAINGKLVIRTSDGERIIRVTACIWKKIPAS